jgi:signal transduction histidine kinase
MALTEVNAIRERLVILGLSSLIVALFMGWGMAWSLVRRVRRLTAAAQEISQGELSHPIGQEEEGDEIGELSRSLDDMRMALKGSLEEIQEWNRQLETRVWESTKELESSYKEIQRSEALRGELLRKMLTAQEEERKRIARELHDETTQSLVGLVMMLETAMALRAKHAGGREEAEGDIERRMTDIKELAINTLDNVHKIILDLRPSALDDLGLVSALRVFAQNRLTPHGAKVRLEMGGDERKLPPHVEIAIFRVVQEAISNIARHAEARNVLIMMEFRDDSICIEIEDDGKGFDMEAAQPRADEIRGLGLVGMSERITLQGGAFRVESRPDRGTRIRIEVPVA